MIIKIISLVLIILVIIMLLPVKAGIVFDEGKLLTELKLLCFKFKLKKTKGKKKKDAPKKKSEEAVFSDKLIKAQERLLHFSDIYAHTSRLTKKYLNVKELTVNLTVGTGDAATTAVSVGVLWGIVYNFIGALGLFLYIDNPNVSVNPDYSESKFKSKVQCIISTRIVYIIIIMISILIKNKVRRKKNGRTSN